MTLLQESLLPVSPEVVWVDIADDELTVHLPHRIIPPWEIARRRGLDAPFKWSGQGRILDRL